MSKHLPPTAAKGKFPYPHRNLHEVAYAAFTLREPRTPVAFRDWVRTYHG